MLLKNVDARSVNSIQTLYDLIMGGAAGHLRAPFEDLELTFGALKVMMLAVATGDVETYEKFDCLSLTFTLADSGELRVARNLTNLRSGGLDIDQLTAKFTGRGTVERTFVEGYVALESALRTIPKHLRNEIFGDIACKTWYSVEVVHTCNPVTVRYDRNALVFHESPVFNVSKDGAVSDASDDAGLRLLIYHVAQMRVPGWSVMGPVPVRLNSVSKRHVDEFVSRIERVQDAASMFDSDTIHDYLYSRAIREVRNAGFVGYNAVKIAERLASVPGARTLTQLKKLVGHSRETDASRLVKNQKDLLTTWFEPLAEAITDLSIELLRDVPSALVADTPAEVGRLRSAVTDAIDVIKRDGNPVAAQMLDTHVARLKTLENVSTPVEGVVFKHEGRRYKLTGAFRAYHQIVSLLTFGRGDVKVTPKNKQLSDLREMITYMMSKG